MHGATMKVELYSYLVDFTFCRDFTANDNDCDRPNGSRHDILQQ